MRILGRLWRRQGREAKLGLLAWPEQHPIAQQKVAGLQVALDERILHQKARVFAGDKEVVSSFYVGYGHESLPKPFKMEAPPPFELEPEEVHEQQDATLEEENADYRKVLEAQVAEKAAELPDPEPEE